MKDKNLNEIIKTMAEYYNIKTSTEGSHIITSSSGDKRNLLEILDNYVENLFPKKEIFNEEYLNIPKEYKIKNKNRENYKSSTKATVQDYPVKYKGVA